MSNNDKGADMNTTASILTTPTTKHQRAAFAQMTEIERDCLQRLASGLYDGTRTVSQCWKDAFALLVDAREGA